MTAPTSEARPEPATPNLGAGAPSGLTRLVLIGLPAAGKSSVGTALAARLSWQHRDTDHWIEQQMGQPVGAIFADQGEDSFRDLETEALRQALTLSSAVISVGGGAVLRPENRQLLASQTVIWLDVSVTTATRRAGLTALRPLLLGDVRQRLTELETERRPLYDSVATWRIDTNRLKPAQVVDQIVTWLDLATADPDLATSEQDEGARS